jgi:hypothetical protein
MQERAMPRLPSVTIVPVLAMACTTFLAPPADAATVLAKMQQNGAGACQGALPAFAGSLRARPLALQNEGSASAFATCSPAYNDYESSAEGASAFNVRLVNNGPVAVEVSCTLVDGDISPSAEPVYLPDTVNVAPGATAVISWTQLDYPAPQPDSILRPNVSCALPAGVGIAYVNYYFQRQIGD